MQIIVSETKQELGKKAAQHGARLIREAIAARGEANIIVATGASQFEMLEQLVQESDIAWHRVTGFHLDEYVALPLIHPASFRLYLWQRFVSQLPTPMRGFHYLSGEDDPQAECRRVGELIKQHPIDVAFVGIGENGHMAFNDPPADFETTEPYLVLDLDERCRQQQVGEGWFKTIDDVPAQAISMSIHQILESKTMIVSVPDERKAQAVKESVEQEISPEYPSTCLQKHRDAHVYLDEASASRLEKPTVQA